MRKITYIGLLLIVCLAVIVFFTRGLRTDGMICVVLDVEGIIPEVDYSGQVVKISDSARVEISAVTPLVDRVTGSARFRVHVSIYCQHLSRYSLSKRTWEDVFLVSSTQVENLLRDHVDLDENQRSTLSGGKDHLLP